MITSIKKQMAWLSLSFTFMITGASALGVPRYEGPGGYQMNFQSVGNNLYDVQITDPSGTGGELFIFTTLPGVDSINSLTINVGEFVLVNLVDTNNEGKFLSVKGCLVYQFRNWFGHRVNYR